MVKDRLVEFFDKKRLIPRRSFAYKKNKSAAMCVNEVVHLIEWYKRMSYFVVVAQIDISKAYDCVNAERLVDNLFFNGVPKDIGLWIENFLSYRILKLGSETVSVFNGLPQGSCLSPTLFNFYTAELHSLEDESTAIFQFADDFFDCFHESV